MSIFTRFDRHAALVGRMADTLGADLGGEAASGLAGAEAVREAVFSCMGCDEVAACEHWLASHAEGASKAPAYCRNKAMLERLAALR